MTTQKNKTYVKGYIYGSDEHYDNPHIFEDTPDNIASFLTQNMMHKCVITDMGDNFIVSSTMGGFIDRCPNQDYLIHKLHPAIIPLQLGEKDPVEIEYINDAYDKEMEFI